MIRFATQVGGQHRRCARRAQPRREALGRVDPHERAEAEVEARGEDEDADEPEPARPRRSGRRAANTTASSSVEAIIAPMPVSSVGRRPRRSTIDSDTTVATSEPTCTSAGQQQQRGVPGEAHLLEDQRAVEDDRVDAGDLDEEAEAEHEQRRAAGTARAASRATEPPRSRRRSSSISSSSRSMSASGSVRSSVVARLVAAALHQVPARRCRAAARAARARASDGTAESASMTRQAPGARERVVDEVGDHDAR